MRRVAPVAMFFAVTSLFAGALPRRFASAVCAHVSVGSAAVDATLAAISATISLFLSSSRVFIKRSSQDLEKIRRTTATPCASTGER